MYHGEYIPTTFTDIDSVESITLGSAILIADEVNIMLTRCMSPPHTAANNLLSHWINFIQHHATQYCNTIIIFTKSAYWADSV